MRRKACENLPSSPTKTIIHPQPYLLHPNLPRPPQGTLIHHLQTLRQEDPCPRRRLRCPSPERGGGYPEFPVRGSSNAGCGAFGKVPKWGKKVREQGPQRRPKEERRRKQAGGRRDAPEDGEGGCKTSSPTNCPLLAHPQGGHPVPSPGGQWEREERE